MTSPTYDSAVAMPGEMDDSPAQSTALPPDEAGDFDGLGTLLELAQEDEAKCAGEIVKKWERQDPAMIRRKVFWDAATLQRRGVRGVRVTYPNRQDLNTVQLYVPLGALDNISPLDRCDILCDRVTAHLLADAPAPDPEPANDSDEARDAAEFTKRVLLEEAGEAGSNYLAKFRRAHNKAATFGSGFLMVWTDMTGGGQATPDEASAGTPQAPESLTIGPNLGGDSTVPNDADPALQASLGGSDSGFAGGSSAGVNANFGGPPPAGSGEVSDGMGPEAGEQTEPQAAPAQWLPKLCLEVLDGRHVRFLPEAVDGISDADGAMVLKVWTLGQLRNRFPKLRSDSPDYIGDAAIETMVNWRTVAMQWVMPWFVKMGFSSQTVFNEQGEPSDETLVGVIMCWYVASPEYPKGCYTIAAGREVLLHAGTWVATVPTAPNAASDPTSQPTQPAQPPMREEPMDIPIAQVRQYDDTDGDDPYGYGLVKRIGPADEVRGTITLAKLDHVDRYSRPNTFLPLGTIVQPEALIQRSGEPIYYNTAGIPVVEEVPQFDSTSLEFFQEATAYEDDASDLQETAQGTENPNSVSGKAKEIVIMQSRVNLSSQRQNLEDGIRRTWRIEVQQIRAWWSKPCRLKYTSPDGRYAERAWTRSDLGGTSNIRIQVGTFTQLTTDQKIQQAIQYAQVPGLVEDPDELQRLVSASINPQLGLMDNPVVQRIRTQVSAWQEGPTPEWLQAYATYQAESEALGPPQLGPDGQPIPNPNAPIPPPSPFDRVPSDLEPNAARLRHRELFRLTQGQGFQTMPGPWRLSAVSEYEAMRQAAGITTIAEQAQAAQMQAQQQAQQKEPPEKGGKAMDHEIVRGADGRPSGIKSRPAQRSNDHGPGNGSAPPTQPALVA